MLAICREGGEESGGVRGLQHGVEGGVKAEDSSKGERG